MACATAVYTAHSPQPMSTAAHLAASEAARDLGRRPAGLLRLPALRFVLDPDILLRSLVAKIHH